MIHPELPEGIKGILEELQHSSISLVWCKGCGCNRPVNSKYVEYLGDGIEGCRFCQSEYYK
jgi:hypothetical protein